MKPKTTLYYFGLLTAAAFLFIAGCVNVDFSSEYPDKNYYVLEVSGPGDSDSAPVGSHLEVRRLRISPRYEGKGLVYRTSDLSYESDFYNQFFKSPSSLISEQIRTWISEASLFEHVVYSATDVENIYILDGVIKELYGDFSLEGSPMAVLRIQFFLTKESGVLSKIILQKSYVEKVPVGSNSAEAIVEGWNQALGKILTALEGDIRSAVSQQKVAGK